MKSTLPARGLAAAAACAALLAGAATAHADTVASGGFSSEPPPPPAQIAMNADGRTAVAPAGAPAEVVKAVAAANRITRKPYKWGGGHGRWRDTGYDCSGTVSYVLHAAGLLKRPRDSSGLMRYGARGPGQWFTIYTNPGHAYVVIAGLRLDTSTAGVSRVGRVPAGARESGPRWRPVLRSPRGYVRRHPISF